VLALIGVAWIVISEIRTRRAQLKMGSDMAPRWVSITKVVLISIVILVAGWLFATGREGTSFPISGVILLLLVILYTFITNNTVFGRHIYAVGGNRQAARLSGVKDRWVDFFVMMNMSVLASLAGMIYVARATASGPQDGNGWELDAIASVFIGGAAVSGGIGTVIGSIIGGLVMAFLNNGLALLGQGADVVSMIKGIVLLFAVGIDVWNKQQGRPSLIGFMTRRFGRQVDPATETFEPNKTYQAPPVDKTSGK
jgi:putative multiple sugar transport system permease protein